ncbi:hypothetical protein L917_16146 [Phytophthora nicotianae]|uniref:Uncharacterized protein n=2 Tax=Phytophthora nicotianae TaxID=4792 RepID=V9FUR0_PHYNI|nr:hypothetical protein F443_03019 [Phytophthora nicotianae P1569]ETL83977.1 hypothetical protein L917_16146 [Phytophthora nicotianae]ETM53707.1 hypothetical protein L914_02848 [Phytophthora nicotianae]
MYAWYFPKGRQYIRKYRSGHRHYWSSETILVTGKIIN